MKLKEISDAIAILEKLTAIPSGSLNAPGVMKVQEALAEILQSLGFQISWHKGQGDSAPQAQLLEAVLPGTSDRWITFVSHADTLDHGVPPGGSIPIIKTGDRMIAPGILDDKASQVVGLWGISKFLEGRSAKTWGLRFVSSPNEELGSQGFQSYYESLSNQTEIALGLEPSYQGRDIVKERRGNRWYDIEVIGMESHSGRDPEKGLSALHDLSLKLAKIVKWNRYSKGLSINVGEVTSDNPTYNLVAGRATAKIDLRFLDIKTRNKIHTKIDKVLKKSALKALASGKKTQTNYKIVDDCPPLKCNRESERLAKMQMEILRRIEGDSKIQAVRSGGAADVSYMARKGLAVLDGLGACGANMHRIDEWVSIPSIETRAQALGELLLLIENTQ